MVQLEKMQSGTTRTAAFIPSASATMVTGSVVEVMTAGALGSTSCITYMKTASWRMSRIMLVPLSTLKKVSASQEATPFSRIRFPIQRTEPIIRITSQLTSSLKSLQCKISIPGKNINARPQMETRVTLSAGIHELRTQRRIITTRMATTIFSSLPGLSKVLSSRMNCLILSG